jgi:hypothetical protein
MMVHAALVFNAADTSAALMHGARTVHGLDRPQGANSSVCMITRCVLLSWVVSGTISDLCHTQCLEPVDDKRVPGQPTAEVYIAYGSRAHDRRGTAERVLWRDWRDVGASGAELEEDS